MNILTSLIRSISFVLWSIRRRTGQLVPVGIACFLLVGATQAIGALHDVASVLTRQQIAQSWRLPYDLFIRPQAAVSQAERDAGWIDPQSVLESYGGISPQQVARIRALPQVAQAIPFATTGWQSIDLVVPIELTPKGVYRISATWNGLGGQGTAENMESVVSYVDVTDLSHLTTEEPFTSPIVQHLVAKDAKTPVIFPLAMPAVQEVIGIPMQEQSMLQQMLLEGIPATPAVHLSLHVERLRQDLGMLPICVKRSDCWEVEPVRQGTINYRTDGVKLLRYSRTQYTATAQELAAGQVTINALGEDIQGPLYRIEMDSSPQQELLPWAFDPPSSSGVLPFSALERMPLINSAVRFVPLEQACAPSSGSCYSGLYVKLNGVGQYSQQSLALLQATSATIVSQTGLHVDILAGSSTRSVALTFHDTSAQQAQSRWRVVGVATQIVHGVDALQIILLALCVGVCLLALGAAGVLVGVGRRKDALLLQQTGWQGYLIVGIFILDALILSIPGSILASGWLLLTAKLWPNSLSPTLIWALLGTGILVYCIALVGAASFGRGRAKRGQGGGKPRPYYTWPNDGCSIVGAGLAPALVNTAPMGISPMTSAPMGISPMTSAPMGISPMTWLPLRWFSRSSSRRTQTVARCVCNIAVFSAIFLLAIEYLLVTGLNQTLIVTVLGSQVRESLEGTQLWVILIVIIAVSLTVGLCTQLLLRERRDELLLLSRVGWEGHAVLLRLLKESWKPAFLSGMMGVLLALGLVIFSAVSPSWLVIAGLLIGGPFAALLLVSSVTAGLARQEIERAFVWR